MNPSELAHYEMLKTNALAELNLATYARNLERVQILSALISVYEEKIKEARK